MWVIGPERAAQTGPGADVWSGLCWFTDAGSGEPSGEAVCVGPGGGGPPQSKVSERLVGQTVTVRLNDLKYE